MTSRMRLILILLAFGVLLLSQLACGGTDNVPDVGEETLDDMIEDTVDVVETGVNTLCKACTLANGTGSDSCTGVCK